MIVFGVTATRNQLCPSRSIREAPSSRFSMTAPMTSRANSFVASRTRNSTSSGRLGARLGTKLLATQCEHPGGRLDDPRRQAGKIDGRRRRRRGYCHGNAPDVGFQDTASYRFWRCGAFPPSPARPCRRDKILPWSGPLSRIADFGRSSRHKKRTKSMTWIFHTRPTPRRIPLLLEQFAHQLECCFLVPPGLNQDIQHLTLAVHRPP